MLSRQLVLLKHSLKPALNTVKVVNTAHIHIGCHHTMKCMSMTSRHLRNHTKNIFSSGLQFRYESSTSAPTGQTQNDLGLGSIPEPPTPLGELAKPCIESVAGEPSFSSLGLGGWSPPGMVQSGLEFLHATCGLPWWGSVVIGTVVLRLLMSPVVVIAQRNSAKLNNNLPTVQNYQLKISEARNRGDKIAFARYNAEMMRFMNEKGVNPLKNVIAPLCQAPVFISMFIGLRGMANLPVESLKTGGILWFVDLTMPDQFFLLPVLTSATLFLTIKVGADSGQATQNMVLMKYFLYAVPLIMFPFIYNFPGLMLVYWTTTNFISLGQVAILRIPAVREWCKIEKLIQHPKTNLPIQDKGFVKNLKEAWTNMKISSELQQRERVDKMAFMKAGRDPIKKTYKYDPTKVNPSTAATIQAKKGS